VTGPDVAALIIAIIGAVAAFRLVTSRNVVRAALYLVVTLAMVGATYILAGAEFVGWTQVLIYVGAIVVLLLFALMLTRAPIGRDTLDNQQRLLALIVGVGVLVGLIFLIQGAFGGKKIAVHATRTQEVGTSLFSGYVLPFEVVSVLLLAALVGAVVLARKGDDE
jgi:NADH:ubiquinone oxidoreductase subunit 6 (subunit J)